MSDNEFSDLKLERKECEKCGAVWINGQHIWGGTGNQGSEADLASLVCNKLGDHRCINPRKDKRVDRHGSIEQDILTVRLTNGREC